jgi:flagellar biosynthetic protein FlhB
VSSESEEKSEAPSDFKLRQARRKGQVAKSADVATLISLAFTLLFLSFTMRWIFAQLIQYFNNLYNKIFSISKIALIPTLNESMRLWLKLSIPVLFLAALGAFMGIAGQIGFLFTTHPLKPELKKLDPIKGLKKIVSKDRLLELIKQIIKFSVIFLIIFYSIKSSLHELILLSRVELSVSLPFIAKVLSHVSIRVLLCFALIALFDLWWQRHAFFKSMRMSKYEVKKEYKQHEGDPHLKFERRRMHQELQEQAAARDIGEASVVITNPYHLAAAIRYKEDMDQAPSLIAKAYGPMAKELIAKAQRSLVPIIRNVALVRDLQFLELNEEIPEALYDSVAEVLIFIHELNKKHKKDAPCE